MSITRHNYEEYFILYLDNELCSEDRRQVELFVKENPDLQEELNLLMLTQLTPDSSYVFTGKEQLLKTPCISIDTSNYEEWLLSYADNELSAEQKIVVEKFIANHPAAKADLEFLQKTKLQPDPAIVFLNKEILYRKEEKIRIIGVRWRRVAAAAALLLAVSATTLILLNNKKENGEIVSDKVEEKKTIQENPVVEQSNNETVVINPQVADNDRIDKKTTEINNPIAKKEKRVEQEKSTPYLLPEKIKQDKLVMADNKEKKNMNDLPQPTNNPYVNKSVEDNPIAMIDRPVKESLTNSIETNSTSAVTPNSSRPLDNIRTASLTESVDPVDGEQPGKKNKLRGFFRKVTRTFEKTTNIKATDDEDRLLLGGLAIKL